MRSRKEGIEPCKRERAVGLRGAVKWENRSTGLCHRNRSARTQHRSSSSGRTSLIPACLWLYLPHLLRRHGRCNPIDIHRRRRLAIRIADRARGREGTPRRAVAGRIRQVHTSTHTSAARILTPHRLGQEPPQLPQEDAFDGRSLAEVRVRAYLAARSMTHSHRFAH